MLSIPTVEDRDDRKEANADDGIKGDKPGGGQLYTKEDEVELLVAPDEVGVEDLLVGNDRERDALE